MEFIESLDLGSIFGIGHFQKQTPWLVPIMRAVAYAGSLWVLGAVAVLAFVGFAALGRWRSGLLVVIVFLVSSVCCLVAEPLIGRPRPDVAWMIPGRPPGYGFPNDAATISIATLGMILLTLTQHFMSRAAKIAVSIGIVGLLLAIGFSQLFLAWGYLTDVLGGWSLGLSLALLCRWLDLRWNQSAVSKTLDSGDLATAWTQPGFNQGSESIKVEKSGMNPDNPPGGVSS
jgi:membrane-associated phospholipid phosphatase